MRRLRFVPLPIAVVASFASLASLAVGCSSGDFNTADQGGDNSSVDSNTDDTSSVVDSSTTPDTNDGSTDKDTTIEPDVTPPIDTMPDGTSPDSAGDADGGTDAHDAADADAADGADTADTGIDSGCSVLACTEKPMCFDRSCSTGSCTYAANLGNCTAKPVCYDRACNTDTTGAADGCHYSPNSSKCTTPPTACYDGTCNSSDSTAGSDGCAYKANSSKCTDAYSCTNDVCAAPGTVGVDTGGCTHAAIAGSCTDSTGCSTGSCSGICTAAAGVLGVGGSAAVTCGGSGTGCRYVLNDSDHDGYAYSASSDNCVAKGAIGVGKDCDDGDLRVYPGETTYYTSAMSGTYMFTSSDPQAATYDYNCDLKADPQFTAFAKCAGTGATPSLTPGWYPISTTIPACGTTGGCGATNCWVTGCVKLGTTWVLPDPVTNPDYFVLQTQACR